MSVRFVGLDVHAETIAVAVADEGGEVRSLGTIPNRLESVRKMIDKLAPVGTVKCEVIAPSLIPTKAGDRVKTDRRYAEKLASCYRAGELTPMWVPDANHEALRDLVRAREALPVGVTRILMRSQDQSSEHASREDSSPKLLATEAERKRAQS